ncbi:MAG: hypothetical protein RDV48_23055 [Candidatus Eremiobacteraeota bacterium]|nr:hypothetical protein [Candidatus Eremiobacteraeota bacterium]
MSEISASQNSSGSNAVREYEDYRKKAPEKPPEKKSDASCECRDCSSLSKEAEGASPEKRLRGLEREKTFPRAHEKQQQAEYSFRDTWGSALEKKHEGKSSRQDARGADRKGSGAKAEPLYPESAALQSMASDFKKLRQENEKIRPRLEEAGLAAPEEGGGTGEAGQAPERAEGARAGDTQAEGAQAAEPQGANATPNNTPNTNTMPDNTNPQQQQMQMMQQMMQMQMQMMQTMMQMMQMMMQMNGVKPGPQPGPQPAPGPGPTPGPNPNPGPSPNPNPGPNPGPINSRYGNNVNFINFGRQKNSGETNGGNFLNDIESHLPSRYGSQYRDRDPVTWSHETTHGINAHISNQNYNSGGRRNTGLYVGGDKGVVLENPNMRKSDVKEHIPQALRGSRYNLYLNQQQAFENEPHYLLDEWASYTNGLQTGVDLGKMGKGRPDNIVGLGVMGALEFTAYSFAEAKAIAEKDPSYWNSEKGKQYKEFMAWHGLRAMDLVREGSPLEKNKEGGQDQYLNELRSGASSKALRDFIAKEFGEDYLRRLLG